MKLKRLTLQPLKFSHTIDLSFLAVREYGGLIYQLLIPFLVLNCGFVFVTSFWYDWPAWNMFLCLFFSLPAIGNLLVWTIARKELIEPAAISESFREADWKQSRMAVVLLGYWNQLLVGVAGIFILFPGLWVAYRFAYSQEKICFDEPENKAQAAAWKSILEQQSFNLFGYFCLLTGFWFALSLMLLLAIDLFLSMVFSISFLIEGLMEGVSFWLLITTDPYVMTLLTACLILCFPFVRLAWMFCYFSVRVRSDCWDISVRMKREVRRLEAVRESR